MWHICTMEHYEVLKENDILNFAGKWMDLEKNTSSEVTQTQKGKYNMGCFFNP